MSTPSPALLKMRDICLSLPDTRETLTWGSPHFRVGDKIFAGYGEKEGRAGIGFKLEREHADVVVQDRRFSRSPYGGQHGWVDMTVDADTDWAQVRALVHESFRLIAPKRTLAKLSAGSEAPATPKPTARKTAARKSAAKKAPARKSAAKKAPARRPAAR